MSLAEARPIVQVMSALRFMCGGAIAITGVARSSNTVHIIAGLCAWEFAVIFVYLLNGAMDIVEDRINGSTRPIARGELSRDTAQRIVITTAILGLACGFAAGPMVAILVSVLMILGYLYSAPPFFLKRNTACTVVLGYLFGMLSYSAGFFSVGGRRMTEAGLVCAIAFSLWTGVIGSATKDLSDVAGDAAAGRRTAAVRVGERPVRCTASVLALLLASGFLTIAADTAPMTVPSAAAMLAGAVLVALVSSGRCRLGVWARTRLTADRKRRRQPYRAFMLTQYAAHLCLLAAAVAVH